MEQRPDLTRVALADITIPPEPRPGCPHQEAGKHCPAWPPSHACNAHEWRAHGFRPWKPGRANTSHRPNPIGDRVVPTGDVPYCNTFSSVRVEGLAADGDGTLHEWSANLAEASTQPCKIRSQHVLVSACTKICRARTRVPPNEYEPTPTPGGFRRLTRNRFRAVASQGRIVLGCQA